jgi:hypothetical protein
VTRLDEALRAGHRVVVTRIDGMTRAAIVGVGTHIPGLPRATLSMALWSLETALERRAAINEAEARGDHKAWMRLLEEAERDAKTRWGISDDR